MTGPKGDKKYKDWRRSYTEMLFVAASVELKQRIPYEKSL
jgi:hypothetical protein